MELSSMFATTLRPGALDSLMCSHARKLSACRRTLQLPWNFNSSNLLCFVNEFQFKMPQIFSRHNYLYNIISIYI
jgi:hypothetical protein